MSNVGFGVATPKPQRRVRYIPLEAGANPTKKRR